MNNRFDMALFGTTGQPANQLPAWVMIARDMRNGFRITMHHTLMAAGIIAIGALLFMFVKPDLADHVKALSPFSTKPLQQAKTTETAPLANVLAASEKMDLQAPIRAMESANATATANAYFSDEDLKIVGTSAEQERVTKWLAKRYRVAGDATNMLVSAAYLTAQEMKLDPLLILSVMAIESRFNPFAESPVGAQGLMQVMSKIHKDKFQKLGGVQAALNPVANIKVGAQILKEYVRRGGSVEAGLKMYVGAAAMETDFGYGAKVLAEYRRLKDVAAGKKVPTFTAVANRAPAKDNIDRTAEDKPEALTRAETSSNNTPV
jgi:soluble lytic murein transglycosylase-like protein